MKIEYIDNQLVIIIPVTKEAVAAAKPSQTRVDPKTGETKGGKMRMLASTHGFTSVNTPNGIVRLSLNAGL